MKLPGTFGIGRVTSNAEDDYVQIAVRDERSGVTFATLKVTLADFTRALTGLGTTPCELEVRGLENVGKQLELKRELVPVPKLGNDETYPTKSAIASARQAQARAAVAPLEVDG